MIPLAPEAPQWMADFAARVEERISMMAQGARLVPKFVVADLPNAAEWESSHERLGYTRLIYVSDESGGATLAFSDGTNFRRVQDRAVVS